MPPHPGVSHSSSEGPASSGSAWGGTSAAGGAENGAKGGGAAAWGGSGVAETSGSKATVLDEALAALFGAEAVAGITGKKNVKVRRSGRDVSPYSKLWFNFMLGLLSWEQKTQNGNPLYQVTRKTLLWERISIIFDERNTI